MCLLSYPPLCHIMRFTAAAPEAALLVGKKLLTLAGNVWEQPEAERPVDSSSVRKRYILVYPDLEGT